MACISLIVVSLTGSPPAPRFPLYAPAPTHAPLVLVPFAQELADSLLQLRKTVDGILMLRTPVLLRRVGGQASADDEPDEGPDAREDGTP